MELAFDRTNRWLRFDAFDTRETTGAGSKHRSKSKFDGSAILFDRIVPNISMTGRVGTRDKLVSHARRVLYLRYSRMTK